MQISELSPAEAGRMRDKLTQVNAGIATNVGMELWQQTQDGARQAARRQAKAARRRACYSVSCSPSTSAPGAVIDASRRRS